MAVTFTRLSWWLWGGKDHRIASSPPSSNSSSDSGLGRRGLDYKSTKAQSTPKKTKNKWKDRDERVIDREYDIVLVPSDSGCLSGEESDDSDWSIGWLEPHAPDFLNEDEGEGSFAVLVPCYGRGYSKMDESSKKRFLGSTGSANLTNVYSDDNKKYMEEWLSSLQEN